MTDASLNSHPARSAGLASFRYMEEKNRDAWLDLFAEDCLFEDPVGSSPLDPEGKGHRKGDLGAFWDASVGRGNMSFEVVTSKACANECAFLVKTTNAIAGLPLLEVEAFTIYKVNENGKVVSVRAYWEFDDTTHEAFA